jgi:hypothetical protein
MVATLEDLDEPSLKFILTQPKNTLVKQHQRLFEMESIDLTLAEEALGAIARKAIDRQTGARGLRSIIAVESQAFDKSRVHGLHHPQRLRGRILILGIGGTSISCLHDQVLAKSMTAMHPDGPASPRKLRQNR